jgi:YggT family protein
MWLAILNIIQIILQVYGYLLIAAAVMSWIPDLTETQIGRLLIRLTDPYLSLFRRFIPPLPLGGIALDIAFIVAVVVYFFVEQEVLHVLVLLVG